MAEQAEIKNMILDTIERLPAEKLMRTLNFLKKLQGEESGKQTGNDATQIFLDKCGGWEDDRTAEEIITEIYAARTSSDRGAGIFNKD